MTRSPKTILVASALCGSLLAGCYGQYAATRAVYTWNGRVSSSPVVRSLLMFGLIVIPVYPFCLLGDWIIFNTAELVTGHNPLAINDDGSVRTRYAAHDYLLRTTAAGKVEVLRDGRLAYRYHEAGSDIVIEDPAGKVVRVMGRHEQAARAQSSRGVF